MLEHSGKPFLVCAKPNKHGAMVVNPSVRHVASKNVPELILVGTGDVRGRRLVLEFDAVELGATHDTLLLIDRQDFPLSHLVLPFLKQQHGTASAGDSFGQERARRSVEQRWILGDRLVATARPMGRGGI